MTKAMSRAEVRHGKVPSAEIEAVLVFLGWRMIGVFTSKVWTQPLLNEGLS